MRCVYGSCSFVRVASCLHLTAVSRDCLPPPSRRLTTSPAEPTLSGLHRTKLDEMMQELLCEDKETRLSHAMKICAFTKEHSIKPWLLGGHMKDFYEVLSSDVQTGSVEGTIGLMKCLHPRDPFVELMARALSRRRNDLDFHDCIYLVHLSLQSPKLATTLKPVFATLRGHLVRLMTEDADLDGPELARAIALLITVRHYSRSTSDTVEAYLAKHLHRLDVDSVHSFLPHVAGGVKLHHSKCNPQLVESVSTYFLELLHKSCGVEDRTEVWGASYGYAFSKFLRFYGQIQFYDERVCEKLKEIFLCPFDCQIHNPIFMSNLAYMCGRVFYYDEDLLEYILQLSHNQVESFHVNELKEMLLAFQSLNYKHQLLLDSVIEVMLRTYDVAHCCDLYWSIISSSIFMNTYNAEVLDRFLTDYMMEGKSAC